MTYSLCLLVLVTIANVYGHKDLSSIPQPMPGIIIPKIMGQWYAAFRRPPFSWSASRGYVNLAPHLLYKGDHAISMKITWGDKVCQKVYSTEQILSPPGVVFMKDHFGDKLSGKAVIVSTDYKSYLVKWGCTKFSIFGEKCVDPYLVVFTRTHKPSPVTIATVNNVLHNIWGLNTHYLDTVLHTGQGACFKKKKI